MSEMDRRTFASVCVSALAAVLRMAGPIRAEPPPASVLTRYSRVPLTTATSGPLRAGGLDPEEEYLFFYPFTSTPCLGRAVQATEVPVRGRGGYAWGGGAGPRRSTVAFTAICPHEWAHPEKAFSAIGYHRKGEPAAVTGGRDGLIVCCAHGSAFDPAAGGRVEQVPAEIPLAAVLLSWDHEQDRFFAEGMLGLDSFDAFFRQFRGKNRTPVEGQAAVMRLRDYSRTVARC